MATILTEKEVDSYKKIANEMRIDILKMIHNAKSGHLGGAFSAVEIFLCLYKKILKHFPDWKNNPAFETRDRFVLSKGHASAALYTVLAEEGYFDKSELMTFRKLGSRLQGHPCSQRLDGIEVSTGSLGQGLSIARGIALALKLDKNPAFVYAYLGDGEIQEGQVWEAAMGASHDKLDNLIAIIDKNDYQIDGSTDEVKSISPIDEKFKAFGFNVLVMDGHDFQSIITTLEEAKASCLKTGKPSVVIANTIKGKGVSFMENTAAWHGKPPSDEDFEKALVELKEGFVC